VRIVYGAGREATSTALTGVGAVVSGARMRTVFVAEYPAVQHRHDDGAIVTVRLKRVNGGYAATCPGCATEFVYRKPSASPTRHYHSPLLPNVKGNFDDGEGGGH